MQHEREGVGASHADSQPLLRSVPTPICGNNQLLSDAMGLPTRMTAGRLTNLLFSTVRDLIHRLLQIAAHVTNVY